MWKDPEVLEESGEKASCKKTTYKKHYAQRKLGKSSSRAQSVPIREAIARASNFIETLIDLDQQDTRWSNRDSTKEVQSKQQVNEEGVQDEDSSEAHESQDNLTSSFGTMSSSTTTPTRLVTTPVLEPAYSGQAAISSVMNNPHPPSLASTSIPPMESYFTPIVPTPSMNITHPFSSIVSFPFFALS